MHFPRTPAGDTGGDCGPFIVLSDPGPEGSIHDVSIGAGISDEGEVTDPALLAPEGGAAVVDPGCRGGVDTATSVEVEEVLRRASAVSRPVPVYRGSPAWTLYRELSPEPASVSDLSTCYWQVLVTLDGVVGQASIEICNGFLANIVTNHVRQSEGRWSVLSAWALTLTLPQEE